MTKQEFVILVDENDNVIGSKEKLAAHQKGLLHRAFSIFVFNSKNNLLIQQRALCKYHSAGLWANTCCGHPRPDELLTAAAKRRLQEEIDVIAEPTERFSFIYKANVSDLMEHELDHVLVAQYNGEVKPNPTEVKDYKWISLENLVKDIGSNPNIYAEWFKIIMQSNLDEISRPS